MSFNFYKFFFADLARVKARVNPRVVEAVGEALHVAGGEEGGEGEAVGEVDGLKSQSPQLNSWTLNWMPTRRYELGTHDYGSSRPFVKKSTSIIAQTWLSDFNTVFALVSQARPTSAREGKCLVNYVYKQCSTGMQLAG